MTTLLAVPNVSEGRDARAIGAIGSAFGAIGSAFGAIGSPVGAIGSAFGAAQVLDVHSDPDHHRTVFTIAGAPGTLAQSVLAGARETIERVDIAHHDGIHPRVGALDVAPIVYLDERDRGAACAEALVLGDLLGEQLGLPVLLYGILARGRTRADLRRGGPAQLATRIERREVVPDFGPRRLHPTAGAVLLAARPALIAFNVELQPPASVADAKAIAASIREGGAEGLPGVRAIGLWLDQNGVAQVSTNVEDHRATPLATVVAAIEEHAPVQEAELVGLAPRAAFDGFPSDIRVRNRRILEDLLGPDH